MEKRRTVRLRNHRSAVRPHRPGGRGESIRLQPRGEVGLDAGDQGRAVIGERGVELDERGAGADLGVGIRAARDAADPDQRQPPLGPAIHLGNQCRRWTEQRPTAEAAGLAAMPALRSEEHTSELQSLMRTSYAVFCLKKKNKTTTTIPHN